MTTHHKLSKKNYLIGAIIIGTAFILQPFSLLFVQMQVAPLLAPLFMGENTGGLPAIAGKEISVENLKLQGNADAPIYLVEYSDYECPFCSKFHDTPKQIVNNSNGKVAWAWKHFPLTQIHQNARPASIAAECISKLAGPEKFWQFSDMLILNQTKLTANLYKTEAAKLGVNAVAFNTCINDATIAAIVDKETSEGESLGVSGTPSTFVVRNENGKLVILENINGALPKETVEAIVAKYSN